LLKVICAISAMSEPTGPHGSLLVAVTVNSSLVYALQLLTIADLDLDCRIALGDILDTPYNLRHGSGEEAAICCVARHAGLRSICLGEEKSSARFRAAGGMCGVDAAAMGTGIVQAMLGEVKVLVKRTRPM